MRSPLRFIWLLACSVAVTAPAAARSPEQTLMAFVRAVQEEGLASAVRYVHSAELAAFRAELEPEIAKRLKSGRMRERFVMFTDPYNRKKMRPFKDDADFVGVFIRWLTTTGQVGITTFDNAQVKPIGTVADGDLRHVVARFVYQLENKKPPGGSAPATDAPDDQPPRTREIVSVTTMKMDNGQPMLVLLPELKGLASLVQQVR